MVPIYEASVCVLPSCIGHRVVVEEADLGLGSSSPPQAPESCLRMTCLGTMFEGTGEFTKT